MIAVIVNNADNTVIHQEQFTDDARWLALSAGTDPATQSIQRFDGDVYPPTGKIEDSGKLRDKTEEEKLSSGEITQAQYDQLLSDAKTSALSRLKSELDDRIANGRGTVTVGNIVWDAGKRYKENIVDEIAPVVAGRLPESSLHQWKDNSGTFHVLLLADFQLLLASIEDWIRSIGEQLYAVKWQHESNVNALTTVKDVDAYDVTTLWPV